MKYTLDSTLGDLLNDPRAKPIVEKHVPGLTTNPLVGMVKGVTLNMLLSLPQAAQLGITKEKVEQILTMVNQQA